MAVEVIMPQMGESIFEGTVTKWLKKPGDKIARDEPLFEISTDKVDAEIPSPAAGVLKEIRVNEGQTVPIQTVVGVIETESGASVAPAPATAPKAQVPRPAEPPAPAPSAAPKTPPSAAPPPEDESIRSSPLVRRLAREHNVDLAAVRGTGAGGRISKKDIQDAIAGGAHRPSAAVPGAATPSAPAAHPAPPATPHPALESAVPRERIYFGRAEAQPMSIMRQRIAEHMVMSKHVSPHVYSIDEVDMTHVAQIRAASEGEFLKRHATRLTYMPFFVRGCVEALRTFPEVNASVDGANLVLHGEINIGIAVALDWGLIVPVLKSAEEKSFLGVQRSINDLAERARAKKLKPEEVQESTFTITNPGVFGGLLGLPIINQPNVAILAIGAIGHRPVVVDDAIAIRSMVYLTLSYDHRAVDGATGHHFLGHIKKYLEGWNEEIL
jgi:2-oxoglutarate dehydrogenase E2 component (dihydrolipoamide succinyltransferase)